MRLKYGWDRSWFNRRGAGGGAFGPPTSVPVNLVPPIITGTLVVGNVLTVASVGTWTNAPTSFTYQWTYGGVPIVGATAATHTVTSGDLATGLECEVTATNVVGSSLPAVSNTIRGAALLRQDGDYILRQDGGRILRQEVLG